MNVMCVWPSLFSAHMINCVGTGIYNTGTNYCVVLNKPTEWTTHKVTQILSNPTYLGHTVNFRTRKKSYKTKTVIYTDESEWVTFENTHEAIIDRETYDTVQRLREAKRRPARMGEMSVFSGMLFCSDCGKRLYLNRCNLLLGGCCRIAERCIFAPLRRYVRCVRKLFVMAIATVATNCGGVFGLIRLFASKKIGRKNVHKLCTGNLQPGGLLSTKVSLLCVTASRRFC